MAAGPNENASFVVYPPHLLQAIRRKVSPPCSAWSVFIQPIYGRPSTCVLASTFILLYLLVWLLPIVRRRDLPFTNGLALYLILQLVDNVQSDTAEHCCPTDPPRLGIDHIQ